MSIAPPPTSTALLVLDYQPSILGSVPHAQLLVESTRAVADRLRAAGGRVGFVRVAFTDEDYAAFPDGSIMGDRVKASRPALDEGQSGAQLHPELGVQPGDLTVRKTRVGAFSTTDLDERLTNAGITDLLLAGVHTSGAVLSTVREAHDLDYRVHVLADLCADPDEDVHAFLVGRVFPKQARVLGVADLSISAP